MGEPTAAELAWTTHQRRVRDVAYRMVGELGVAEDIAQEVAVRLLGADLDTIRDLEGWLVTVTARLALDHLRSAAVTRRAYPGRWLPEPVVTGPDGADPADRVTLDESVRLGLLAVMEQLTPAERTALLLHDVFGVPFEEVGRIVGRSTGACRQLASRARRHVRRQGRRGTDDPQAHQLLVERFRSAAADGDIDGLIALLAPDATGEFDAGGLVPDAPTGLVPGPERIATTLVGAVHGRASAYRPVQVNGEPGIAIMVGATTVAVLALASRHGRVVHVYAVGNPTKLAGDR